MEILRQVTLLEEQGIIKRSNAQYYSQVILAPKPNDEWRLCVDFRNLNNASLENGTHPMANIKNMLNRIGDHKSKFFGKIDLTQGYYQCSVTLATMVLTAFIVYCGIFEFTRLHIVTLSDLFRILFLSIRDRTLSSGPKKPD
jgi:hypothetical protein